MVRYFIAFKGLIDMSLQKQSPRLKPSTLSGAIRYCRIFVSFFVLCGCTEHQPPQAQSALPMNSHPFNGIKSDSIAPPKVITITAKNRPKIVLAGNPEIRIDSTRGGDLFFTNYNTEQGLVLSSIYCGFADKEGNLWFGTAGGGVSRYDGKSFTNFNLAQGLAANEVSKIFQDKDDNIWFLTAEGLSRFDGWRFTTYPKTLGLVTDSVWCTMQDRMGNLWFGTYAQGVIKFDGNSFTKYTTAQGLGGNEIFSMIQDKWGNYWFGTSRNGVTKYDGRSFINYNKVQGLVGNHVRGIAQDRVGNLWFATEAGVSRYDGVRFANFAKSDGLADISTSKILQDKVGNIWITFRDGGVSKFDGKRFTNFSGAQGPKGTNVATILEDNEGNLWFGSEAGLSRYDGKKFTNYTMAQGLPGDDIHDITKDHAGNLWFSTMGGGISKYSGSRFTDYTKSSGLEATLVFHITHDKSGNLWMVTYGKGAVKYDGRIFARYTTDQGLLSNYIYGIIEDNIGNIWFATYEGLSKYDGKRFTNYTTYQGLPSNTLYCLIQDKKANIWIGTQGDGVSKFDGKSFSNYSKAQGLPDNHVQTILEDKSGNLWIGTQGGGVSKFDGKTFTNYSTLQGLANNSVSAIIQDKNANIWFGTDGGASEFDGIHFKNFTTASGLADNGVNAIIEDSLRNIVWFGTNQGLTGLKQNINSNRENEHSDFEVFNNKTGYPIKDLNTNAISLDVNGKIWTGCGNGKLLRFDYAAVNRNPKPLSLQLQKIQVKNVDMCWNNLIRRRDGIRICDSLALLNEMITTFGQVLPSIILDSLRNDYGDIKFDSVARFYPIPLNLILPYRDNNLTFYFAAIEPAMPNQVKYQYILEGYDKSWSPLNNVTSASYGHIGEGDYTFRLKALSPYGIWSETEYTFKVLPPWYRAWWSYTFYGICLLASIYFTDRIRRKVVIERERAKAREKELEQAKEIEKAYTELKATQAQLIQSEKMASLGELTAGIAHEIQNPLNFVNNFSEVNKELIHEALESIKAGNPNAAAVLLSTLQDNEDKIIHHGRRADAIVKGMLQHSRASTGQKELANINAIVDECLRLSYHAIRAKDKSFKATLKTDLDESIASIPLVQQDIVRVLVNLFNNAFYTVSEKAKQTDFGYEPTVSVITKKVNNKVEIRIKDNGSGIPQKVLDKIFQPFFTTKPSGQGTGLGLSMSYDIVKANGGEIKVDTKEGEGAEFIIQLPNIGQTK
jgi:ligand-binding sensor domain-containing protein/signal transduction histidine kinase